MNPQPIFCDIYDDDAYPVLCNNEREYKHLQFNKELETLLENKKFDESKELIENLDYKPLYELRKIIYGVLTLLFATIFVMKIMML